MAIEVLLMDNVESLGAEGAVVSVAEGYARNYLFPKKLAEPVTRAARARLVKLQEERRVRREADLAGARALAAKLGELSCTIAVKVGEKEQLYGSVTNADVAAALKAIGHEVDRHAIVLESPLKELGVFDVPIKLHPEVQATIKVWIVEE